MRVTVDRGPEDERTSGRPPPGKLLSTAARRPVAPATINAGRNFQHA